MKLKYLIAALILPMAMAAATMHAGTWDTGTFTVPAALSVPSTNGATVTATTASSYTLQPGCSLRVNVTDNANGATTGTFIHGFDLYDGTDWTTSGALFATNTLAGTTNVTVTAVFTPAQLAGAQAIRPGYVVSPTGAIQATNSQISYASYH